MARTWSRRSLALLASSLAAVLLAGCPSAAPPTSLNCTPSVGLLPDFRLEGAEEPFRVTRPGMGGAAVVEIPLVDVKPGDFDWVLWNVLGATGYDEPPNTMEYVIEDNPTFGTQSTLVKVVVYAETPVNTYDLRVRGLAHTGSFFDGDFTVVGECFRAFRLIVD